METMHNKILILLMLITFSATAQKSIFWLNKPSNNIVNWVGGSTGNPYYSKDSYTWTENTSISGTNNIEWNGERWMCVSPSSFKYSFNGINWTSFTLPIYQTSIGASEIMWDNYNKLWLINAISNNISYDTLNIVSSTNGVDWMYNEIPYSFSKIISVGNRYVAILSSESSPYIYYANSINEWNRYPIYQLFDGLRVLDIYWDGQYVVMTGYYYPSGTRKGIILKSLDGLNYTASYIDENQNAFSQITKFNNYWYIGSDVKIGLYDNYIRSNDLTNWAYVGSLDLLDAITISESNATNIVAGNHSSIDGVNYTLISYGGNEVKSRYIDNYPAMIHSCPSISMNISEISTSYIRAQVVFNSDGGTDVVEKGLCWSTAASPTTFNSHTNDGFGGFSYTARSGVLMAGTTYYVRAYATNSTCTWYSNEQMTITYSSLLASVETYGVTNITTTSAILSGQVLSDGGTDVTDRGFCWAASENPTISNDNISSGSGLGVFNANVYGFDNNTTYHVRAYALNSSGYSYGTDIIFTTGTPIYEIPTLQGINISNITLSSADAQSTIISDGGTTLTGLGFCYSTTNPNPTTSDTTIGGTSFGGNLTASLTGLSSPTTYYIRAYATNSVGTGYSSVTSFTTNTNILATLSSSLFNETSTDVSVQWKITLSQPSAGYVIFPLIITNSDNTGTTTIGIIFSEGQQISTIISVYSKITTQYTAHCNFDVVPDGYTGSNSASYIIPALSGSVPTISISVSSNDITSDGIYADGIDLVDNGSAITEKGACISVLPNPTISDTTYVYSGSGTASFTVVPTGLQCGTTYHIRMYATNSVGTGYSADYQFTTTSSNQGQVTLFTRVNTVEGGNVYITSLESAEQACFDYNNRTVISIGGITVRFDQIAIGAKTWNPIIDCQQNGSTGYYLIGGTIMSVIHLQSGVIDYISQCYP